MSIRTFDSVYMQSILLRKGVSLSPTYSDDARFARDLLKYATAGKVRLLKLLQIFRAESGFSGPRMI